MEALFVEINGAYSRGGKGTTTALIVVACVTHAWKGVAEVFTMSGEPPDRWRLYLIDDQHHHCLQLQMPPPPIQVARGRASADLLTLLAGVEEAGMKAAALIVAAAPHSKAMVPIAPVPCRAGNIWITLWRGDLLELLQAQLNLHSTPAPLKMLRRLSRTHMRAEFTGNAMGSLRSVYVLGSLVCWECGRMAVGLQCCSRCQLAWYCERQCQLRHLAHHKRTCKQLAELAGADLHRALQGTPDMQWAEHLVSAVMSNAQAAQLVEPNPVICRQEHFMETYDWQQLVPSMRGPGSA